jgi:ADP-ribose pyrophosphatase
MPSSKTILTTERFKVDEVTRTLANGKPKTRSVIRHPGAVAVIPMVDDDHVCLIWNYRVSVDKVLLEIPAGTLEPNEPPLETARRELQEETGYTAKSWRELAFFYLSPGVLDEKMHVYVAEGLTPGATDLDEGEEVENSITRWSDAIDLALSGQITDAKTIAALLLYDRIRQRK